MLEISDVKHLIGLPWKRAATGPDSYDCWGLVLHCLKLMNVRTDIKVNYGFPEGIETEFLHSLPNWQLTEFGKHNNCIVYCYRGEFPAHIGFVIGGFVLHSDGDDKRPGEIKLNTVRSMKKVFTKLEFYTWL